MTDEVEKTEDGDEAEGESAAPDFAPAAPLPAHDDEMVDDDPHTSFDTPVAASDTFVDVYGVGAPKTNYDEEEDEEEELLGEGFETEDSEAY